MALAVPLTARRMISARYDCVTERRMGWCGGPSNAAAQPSCPWHSQRSWASSGPRLTGKTCSWRAHRPLPWPWGQHWEGEPP
eukprot:4199090-Amphidinium_carterae.1